MSEIVHVPGLGRTDGEESEHDRGKRERRQAKSERKDAVMVRRQAVAERLLAHWPYRAIARELGISLGLVAKDVKFIRAGWAERAGQSYDAFVREENAKLDQVEMALLPKVLHGARDGGVSLGAVQMWIAVQDRRARLMGLDKPMKTEVTIDILDVEAQRARARELLDEVGAKRDQKSA